MKWLRPVFVFMFLCGCWWFGSVGLLKFVNWTIAIGIDDEIKVCIPYMIMVGLSLFGTTVFYTFKDDSNEP